MLWQGTVIFNKFFFKAVPHDEEIMEIFMKNILTLIQDRRSLRLPFDPERRIAKSDLMKILEAARWTPTAHNMQNFEIIIVDDKKLLEAIGKIKNPTSNIFIRENYKQLSFSEKELLKKKTGLLAAMFPSFMITPGAKPTDFERQKMGYAFGKLIQSSSVLLIVLYDPERRAPASEGDFLGIISLGCAMENMWLMAQSLGIGVHILSILSSDPIEKKIKRILNIPKRLKIAFSLRLGYPISAPAKHLRVRRDVKDFVHCNRFGNKGLG